MGSGWGDIVSGFGEESPETRTWGLFGLGGDTQPDLQSYRLAPALAQPRRGLPVITHTLCPGALVWAPEWLQMLRVECRRLSLAASLACHTNSVECVLFPFETCKEQHNSVLFLFLSP